MTEYTLLSFVLNIKFILVLVDEGGWFRRWSPQQHNYRQERENEMRINSLTPTQWKLDLAFISCRVCVRVFVWRISRLIGEQNALNKDKTHIEHFLSLSLIHTAPHSGCSLSLLLFFFRPFSTIINILHTVSLSLSCTPQYGYLISYHHHHHDHGVGPTYVIDREKNEKYVASPTNYSRSSQVVLFGGRSTVRPFVRPEASFKHTPNENNKNQLYNFTLVERQNPTIYTGIGFTEFSMSRASEKRFFQSEPNRICCSSDDSGGHFEKKGSSSCCWPLFSRLCSRRSPSSIRERSRWRSVRFRSDVVLCTALSGKRETDR